MNGSSGPRQVLIIRHGEKLGSADNDQEGGPDLSPRGSARATALPLLFVPVSPQTACALTANSHHVNLAYGTVDISGSTPRFSLPAAVFATRASHHSNRPIETVSPLVAAFNLPLEADHPDDRYDKVAEDLLNKPEYVGKIILVCWHHGNIPALARALDVDNPPPWPGSVFDRIWQLDYAGGRPVLSDQPQRLLFGDAAT
jgi:hypothetical protein